MGFTDLLSQLRQGPGEGESLPESIYDDLAGEYQLAVDGGIARAAALQASLDEALATNVQLKATNFDLLSAAGPTVMEENGAITAAEEAEMEDPDNPKGVDALFASDDEDDD